MKRVAGLLLLMSLGFGCAASAPMPERAASHEQTSGAELFRLAHRFAAQGDATRAEQYALLAIEHGVPRRTVLPLLIAVCLRASRISAALVHAEATLRVTPDDTALRFLVAVLQAALGRRAEALREVSALLRQQPDHTRALALRSELEGDGR